MARGLSSLVKAAAEAGEVRPVLLLDLQFSTPLYLWTGIGNLAWNGQTWLGMGDLLGIGTIEETGAVEAPGIAVRLNALDSALISAALAEDVQGRPMTLWLGFMDANGALIDSPVGPFKYRMDVFDIDDDPDRPSITLTAENELAALKRPNERRRTHQDQQIDYPGDLGLEFVPSIQNKELKWGRS